MGVVVMPVVARMGREVGRSRRGQGHHGQSEGGEKLGLGHGRPPGIYGNRH
ncbi:hypothetical protein ABIF07_000640 [Bradyrhizobium elkanii]